MLNILLMNSELIAPCGINCATCAAYFGYTMSGTKRKHACLGCRLRNNDGEKRHLQRKSCAFLKKHCQILANDKVRFCFECADYPCTNLKKLDDRYKKKYSMNLIENLNFIKSHGIEKFLNNQQEKFTCPTCGATLCVHTGRCYSCLHLTENVQIS